MSILMNLFILVASVTTASLTDPRPVSKKDACTYWHNFTSQMNEMYKSHSFLNYNCTYDANKCDGAECIGSIRYTLIQDLSANFCFGLRVNHCADPISLDMYYMDPNNAAANFTDRVHHQDSKEIKSLSKDLGSLGKIEPFLFFNLTRPVPHHVLFGVKLKIRVISAFGTQSWPKEFQQDIIPSAEIPVTPCPHIKKNIPLLKPRCISHGMSMVTTPVPTGPVKINSKTYNKTCSLHVYPVCSENEVCSQSDQKTDNGKCLCMNNLPIDFRTGYCSGPAIPHPSHPFTTLAPNVQPLHPQPLSQKKTINGAMIGGIVGGVFLVAILVVVAIVIFKRHRNNQNYIGRLLLNDDNDNDNVI